MTQPGEPSSNPGQAPKPSGSTPQKKTARFQPRPFGKYQLLREIGHGGKGVVYEALDGVLSRKVALKMILPQPGLDPAELKREEDRFLVEARLSANLPKHPHIVSVYEAGDIDGRRYLAAELVIGQPLIRWRRNVAPKQQLEVLRDVALAMEHSHKHGIVHRDLKPQNILMDAEGQPHVTDFGLAKMIGQKEDTAAVAPGLILGTPTYMSPEHARGLPNVDHRTDLYSLGVMLHEILTGRAPFPGESSTEIMDKVVNSPLPPLVLLPGLPASLKATCQKALSKSPAQRHPNARTFADELTSALLEMQGEATGGVPVAEPNKKKPVLLLAGIGAAAVVAIGVVLALVLSGGPDLKKVETGLALGDQRMSEGKYRDAIQAYEQALHEDPSNARAQQSRALAEKRYGDQLASEKRRAAEDAADEARRQEAEKGKAQQDDLKKQIEAQRRAEEENQAFLKREQIKAEEEKRKAEERAKAAEDALKAKEETAKTPTPEPGKPVPPKPAPTPTPNPPVPGKPGIRPDTSPTVVPTGVAKVLEDGTLHIEAEDYTGGEIPVEGDDYHDTTPGNNGRRYRAQDVDIGQVNEAEGGGYFVADPSPGEWLRYKFEGGGRYQVEVRFYSRDAAKIHLEVDGADVTGPIDLPDVSGKKSQAQWHVTTAYTQKFPEGPHALKLVWDAGSRVGVDWLRLKKLVPKPVPDAAATAEAQKTIKEAFKGDYAKKSPADLVLLAKKLIDEARKIQNDPVSQYAMLSEARDLAAQGGDLTLALEAVEEIERGYVIEAFAMKVATAGTASRSAKSPAAWKDVAEAYLALADECADREDYEQAIVLAGKADAAAKSGHDVPTSTTAQARVKELTAVRDEFRALQAALKTLETKADDPVANLAVGIYRCFARGDWAKGLPMIAKGSDAALALVAKREIDVADDPVEQAALGDGWREAASKRSTGLLRTRFEGRALMWYEKALPGLTGVPKLKVEGYIEVLAKSVYGTDSLRKGLVFLMEPSRDYAEGYREFVAGSRASSNNVAIANDGGLRVLRAFGGWVEYAASEPVKAISKNGSVFVWIKADKYPRGGLVDRGEQKLKQGGDFGLWVGNGRLGASFNGDGRGTQWSKTDLPAARWVHGGFTWDEKTITFYVDGREDSSVPVGSAGVPQRRGTRVYVGSNALGNESFQGLIGSALIYNRTLTDQEVQQLYLGTRARFR